MKQATRCSVAALDEGAFDDVAETRARQRPAAPRREPIFLPAVRQEGRQGAAAMRGREDSSECSPQGASGPLLLLAMPGWTEPSGRCQCVTYRDCGLHGQLRTSAPGSVRLSGLPGPGGTRRGALRGALRGARTARRPDGPWCPSAKDVTPPRGHLAPCGAPRRPSRQRQGKGLCKGNPVFSSAGGGFQIGSSRKVVRERGFSWRGFVDGGRQRLSAFCNAFANASALQHCILFVDRCLPRVQL